MKSIYRLIIPSFLVLFGCSTDQNNNMKIQTVEETRNKLLMPWTGPYQGVPAFDLMSIEAVEEAILLGMEWALEEYDSIANQLTEPTFENTILALEKVGKPLDRAFTYYGIYSSNLSSPEFRAVEERLAPKLSEYNSKIIQNEKLFARIKAVFESDEKSALPADAKRLLDLVYQRYEMNGAALDAEKKNRYAEISKRLSSLYTQFSNNVLHDEEAYVHYINEDEAEGLSGDYKKAAAQLAEDKGKPGFYAVVNTRSSVDPFLTYSTNRELRKRVWETFYARGDNGDEFDNNAIISEILLLRKERVALMGYEDFATWRLQNRMAQTPDKAMALLMKMWPAAISRVEEEVADMQRIAEEMKHDIVIEPWDYWFYAEKVREQKYDLNSEEVKQYLQLNKLTEAMHFVARELFDFEFKRINDGSVPVFHKDVQVWEVRNQKTDKLVGLWYLDPYARQGKRSGAWATSYRSHSTYDGVENVLASNNSNFIAPAPGMPLLVSWDDATTFFHEFGHALHYLSSNVRYPTLNGGVRDYIEFQSQLLERWLSTEEVINKYLVHAETGEPMPASLVEKIRNAATFNQGFATVEYLASAIIDMKIHMADPENLDPDEFEKETLLALAMPSEIRMRHRTPHFSHVFSGEGYAAGYYGYLWADVLTSDAAEAFQSAPGGYYDKDLAASLVKYLFAPGNSIDPAEAYRSFRGADPNVEALMRDRGFID